MLERDRRRQEEWKWEKKAGLEHIIHTGSFDRRLQNNTLSILFVVPPPFPSAGPSLINLLLSVYKYSLFFGWRSWVWVQTDHLPSILEQTINSVGLRLNVLTAFWQRWEPLWVVKVLCEQSGWARPAAKVDDTDRHYCVCARNKMCLLQNRFLSPAESKNLIGNRGAYYSQR